MAAGDDDAASTERTRRIYRAGIWLPLILPAAIIGMQRALDLNPGNGLPQKVTQLMAASLLYGGLPYSVLALWATWWTAGRPAADIRRLILRAPWLMAGFFALTSVAVGVTVGQPVPFLAVAVLGATVAIPLGYAYAAFVLWAAEAFGKAGPT